MLSLYPGDENLSELMYDLYMYQKVVGVGKESCIENNEFILATVYMMHNTADLL